MFHVKIDVLVCRTVLISKIVSIIKKYFKVFFKVEHLFSQ